MTAHEHSHCKTVIVRVTTYFLWRNIEEKLSLYYINRCYFFLSGALQSAFRGKNLILGGQILPSKSLSSLKKAGKYNNNIVIALPVSIPIHGYMHILQSCIALSLVCTVFLQL